MLVKTVLVETKFSDILAPWTERHPCTLDRDTRISWFKIMLEKTMLVEAMVMENFVS